MFRARLPRWIACGVALVAASAEAAQAQNPDPNAPYPLRVLEFDEASNRIDGALPFGERFLLRVPIPDSVVAIELEVGRLVRRDLVEAQRTERRVPDGVLATDDLTFEVDPLEPRADYAFDLSYRRKSPADARPGARRPAKRRVTGRTETSFVAHILTDLGVMWSRGYVGGITSASVYAVPINKKESLTWSAMGMLRRVGLFVGLTPFEFHSTVNVQKLYRLGSPVVGAHVRITRSTRLGTGVLFFEQPDANPLVDRPVSKRDVFLSFTADFSYKDPLGPLGALFGS